MNIKNIFEKDGEISVTRVAMFVAAILVVVLLMAIACFSFFNPTLGKKLISFLPVFKSQSNNTAEKSAELPPAIIRDREAQATPSRHSFSHQTNE